MFSLEFKLLRFDCLKRDNFNLKNSISKFKNLNEYVFSTTLFLSTTIDAKTLLIF